MIVSVEFVGPYAAADVALRDAPEWPPHPDRLYQAFVDAAYLDEPGELAALEWLESQPAPGIACDDAVLMETAQSFVPVNYPDVHPLDDRRVRQPRTFPMAWPKGRVDFIWPDPEPEVLSPLCDIAGRVSHVGRAESVSLVEVRTGSMKPVLKPDPDGDLSLRVPHTGRFRQLEQAFLSGKFSSTAPWVSYGLADESPVAGPWGEMVAVRLRHPLRVESLVEATEALRRAVLSVLGDRAPEVVHGHGRHDHIAWLGLPNLSPYEKGELLGLAMLLPRGISPSERALCVRALLAVRFILPAGRRVELELPTVALSLASRTWNQASKQWQSVSPVVLDRYPRRNLNLVDALKDCVERAGYPRPNSVEVTEQGAKGMPQARRFRLRRPGRLYAHVRVEFDQPVAGPMLIGSERYFGLGLCLPV